MIHPYQLHSLDTLYREETLKEARVRHLEQRAKANRRPRSEEEQVRSPWLSKLAAAVGLS
jgi:hypothetical protein